MSFIKRLFKTAESAATEDSERVASSSPEVKKGLFQKKDEPRNPYVNAWVKEGDPHVFVGIDYSLCKSVELTYLNEKADSAGEKQVAEGLLVRIISEEPKKGVKYIYRGIKPEDSEFELWFGRKVYSSDTNLKEALRLGTEKLDPAKNDVSIKVISFNIVTPVGTGSLDFGD